MDEFTSISGILDKIMNVLEFDQFGDTNRGSSGDNNNEERRFCFTHSKSEFWTVRI